ncbi:forkhead-associated protein [Mycobacterium shimoidei]|uniref:Forkhead-associated protein n=1 Tax=Mycobacterium shimoidei TaxID=29313 RepID=A0A1E3TF71_MYCSH|nr:forkhead-associated protein [Mycobacterium shimoidei]MCV7259130.1 XRE family transcriptional regulator [Mycobacterium shimoidei]ODR13067.1 forkhead-associated protein [Mycobacterium shimoidei]ORW83333.1 forkhead-associated protein [Mycobacterium shimoidei]SRX95119.1 Unknown alanine rich protein [Mycobacterium tuberculosis H37Rv] [Mycobacterium shimoidei]
MGEFDPNEGEAQVIVTLADAAMHMYRAAIDSLPFPEDKKFQKRAEVVLSGLRKLRAGLAEAATKSRSTPTVIAALTDVRRRYDDLMERAASAPGSTLGQQLYTARIRAKLSAEEAARGVGLRPELPDELEAGATPSEEEVVKVHQLIAALREVNGDGDYQPSSQANVNGWDEAMALNGAGQEADVETH